jgi:methyl-accepting chemotaxis protein
MRLKIIKLFALFVIALATLATLSVRMGRTLSSSNEGIGKLSSDSDVLSRNMQQLSLSIAQSFSRADGEAAKQDFEIARKSLQVVEDMAGSIEKNPAYIEILTADISKYSAEIEAKASSVGNAPGSEPQKGSETTTEESSKAANPSDATVQATTLGALVSTSKQEANRLKLSLSEVITSVEEVYQLKIQLEEHRKTLSSSFRELPFERYASRFPSAWPDIYRGVLTILSSSSRRDLKFAGEGKFNKAAETIKESLGKNDAFDKLATDFETAARTASQAATVTASFVHDKFSVETNLLATSIDKLQKYSESMNNAAKTEVIASAVNQNFLSIALSLAVIFFGSLLVWFTVGRIVRKLQAVIDSVQDQSDGINSISSSVANASEILSESVNGQGAAIHETVASMKEVGSMVSSTSQEAQTAAKVTTTLAEKMKELQQANTELRGIVKTFDEIEEKTQVINQIVFKTQLLSFNASIEATRAGAHGRGFTVVAQEVGKLAELSGAAAKEINSLLKSSSSRVRSTVETAGNRIADFEVGVKQIRESAESIAQSSIEQQSGIDMNSKAMDKMNQLTLRNSKNAEILLGISKDLNNGSKSIQTELGNLRLVVNETASEKGAVAAFVKIISPIFQQLGLFVDGKLEQIKQQNAQRLLQKNQAQTSSAETSQGAEDLQGSSVVRTQEETSSEKVDHKHKSFKKAG